MTRARSDPRRVAVLSVMVLGAVLYAVTSGDDGWLDVLRFAAAAVAGCCIGIAMRRLDEGVTARVAATDAQRLADVALRVGPIVGVAVAIIVAAAGGFSDSASVSLSGALAGMLVTVGFLYPLPHVRGPR